MRQKSARCGFGWGGARRNSGGRRPGAGRPRKYPANYGEATSTRDLLRHYPQRAAKVLLEALEHWCNKPGCDCYRIRFDAACDIMDRAGIGRLRPVKWEDPEPQEMPPLVWINSGES